VQATTGHGDARRIAEEFARMGFDVLISHGGDGTAMQVAAGIAARGLRWG
jgi:diacylglycerol kinase family enzyme